MNINEDELLKIFGTDELAKLFSEMREDLQKQTVIKAFRKAAKIIGNKLKDELQTSLKKSEKFVKQVGNKEDKKNNSPILMVGIKNKSYGKLSHLFENGTVERFYISSKNNSLFKKNAKGNKHNTGKIKGKKFFENTVNSTESEVNENIYNEIKQAFEKLINKYDKQVKK